MSVAELKAVEQTEQQDADSKIREAFDAAVAANKDEDSIKMSMIQAGASFKNVARMYNQFMIDAGLALAKEDRDAIVSKAVTASDISTEEGYEKAIEAIMEEINEITVRSAGALVRGYAKKNDLTYFVPEKEPTGPTGFTKRYLDWIVTTLGTNGELPTQDQAKDCIHGRNGFDETSNNTKRNETHFLGYITFAKRLIGSVA
jgi:hypothetical protein